MREPQFDLNSQLEDRHWWFVGRRRILRDVVLHLRPQGAVLLEAGCGTGGNVRHLKRWCECVGLDPAREAIAKAREADPEGQYVLGDSPEHVAEHLAASSVLLLADVLEHVENDDAMLRRWVLAMSPGSHLVVTVPADRRLWSRHDESHCHFRRYDRASLSRLWRELPVEVQLLAPLNWRLYPAIRFARWIGRQRGRAWGESDTDLRLPPTWANRCLTSVFANESKHIVHWLDQKIVYPPARSGVSLLAVLRRRDSELPTETSHENVLDSTVL